MKVNAFVYARLIAYLVDHDCTCFELAEFTGLHYRTVYNYVGELHKAKVVHICGWEKSSYNADLGRIFRFGKGKDRPREQKSATESKRAWRAKQRQRLINGALVGTPAVLRNGSGTCDG